MGFEPVSLEPATGELATSSMSCERTGCVTDPGQPVDESPRGDCQPPFGMAAFEKMQGCVKHRGAGRVGEPVGSRSRRLHRHARDNFNTVCCRCR